MFQLNQPTIKNQVLTWSRDLTIQTFHAFMPDVSVIILVGKEELHIKRCLEKLAPLAPRQVFVVESQKGDRTHEVAAETAKSLGWEVGECLNVGIGECLNVGSGRAPRVDCWSQARVKIDEWLAGVDEESFAVALERLVDEKSAVGEYLFKRPEDRELAILGAKQFFREFSQRIVTMSDGRCVYFAPDARAKGRNAKNAISWAEYAFHAVSSGGAKVAGKDYHERWYNPHKVPAFAAIVGVLNDERCFVRLSRSAIQDAIVFAGAGFAGEALQVVTRLDEMGNMDANLSEVTFTSSGKGQKKPPRLVPLTEAVQTVVHHQNTAGSYSSDKDMLANPSGLRKGGREKCLVQTFLSLIWHAWPGLQSTQFDWALDNLPIEGSWILRLDADEYLTDESVLWLKTKLDEMPEEVAALEFTLERRFCGGGIRHATNGIKMVRMFRCGKGRYAETEMDERLVVEGTVLPVPVVFFDDNLNGMDWWREKHRGYAKREARQAAESMEMGVWVDPRKEKYYRMPRYIRAFVYFAIRYFLKGGFLDGYAGWMWNFWQGLWYRWMVDREIGRLRDG